MRTTKQWWNEVRNNDDKMIDWLKKQYHGEVTAEKRIRELVSKFNLTGKKACIINKIADDEKKHAEWIKDLLISRGIGASVLDKEERYWSQVLVEKDYSFEEICAIGHHAEIMRLDRISLLAKDDKFKDIAEVFMKILPEETFHAKAFGSLSNAEMIEKTKNNHQRGMEAIGLVN